MKRGGLCFFDSLDIHYEYEYQGYELDGDPYLPDFWLPKQRAFIEIKGQSPTEREIHLGKSLCKHTTIPVIFFWGGFQPHPFDMVGTGYYIGHRDNIVECPMLPAIDESGKFSFYDIEYSDRNHCFHPEIMKAYSNARTARFEHGETPRI